MSSLCNCVYFTRKSGTKGTMFSSFLKSPIKFWYTSQSNITLFSLQLRAKNVVLKPFLWHKKILQELDLTFWEHDIIGCKSISKSSSGKSLLKQTNKNCSEMLLTQVQINYNNNSRINSDLKIKSHGAVFPNLDMLALRYP